MTFLRLLFACALAIGLSSCRKKSDAAAKEISEAGYTMTAEGWFSAVRGNNVSVMKKMVSGGFDGEIKDTEGNGALHLAVAAGAKEVAQYLLNHGFSIDEPGAEGRTPLMTAVLADKPAMVKWLLQQGANPKSKNANGFMALMLAVTQGAETSVEELAPYHREDLDSALLLAALVGKAEIIDTLTNYGASVYARMEDGRTPLMLAAQNGHKEAAEILIEIGASRFATTESGDTAHSLAVAAGHEDLAEMIDKRFSGETLALESDEEVAKAMEEYVSQSEEYPEDADSGASDGADTSSVSESSGEQQTGNVHEIPAQSIEGARIGKKEHRSAQNILKDESDNDTPLIMRHYRERELPVEVTQVSGGEASLRIVGSPTKNAQVKAGEIIPGSSLSVVRVFSRTEQGKLNDGAPIEIGMIEVEDLRSGRRMEWAAGRPATGHDPVALVEDATTRRRYLARPGQKFTSEDGREFIVNDVRPGQLLIEETTSGEVLTLHLRGPKG